MQLNNKTILITGGATGIGFELARLLVGKGNTVLVCGRRQTRLDEAAAAIKGLRTYVCDVGDPAQCQAMFDAIKSDGFKVDMLVNNAAVLAYDKFDGLTTDMQAIRNTFNGNVLGPMELVNLFLPEMLAQKDAVIVNVGSPAGRCAIALIPVYAATKAALDFYTRALRVQLKGKVKVVEVFPPTVTTEMTEQIQSATGLMMTSTQCAENLLRQLEKDKDEIWIGTEARLFRLLDAVFHPLVFWIVNGSSGVKRKK
jgi:uncharacterized oxidoreductase